jgi:hypothetical protein
MACQAFVTEVEVLATEREYREGELGATRSVVLVVGSGARGLDEPPEIYGVWLVDGRSSWCAGLVGRWSRGYLGNRGKFSKNFQNTLGSRFHPLKQFFFFFFFFSSSKKSH